MVGLLVLGANSSPVPDAGPPVSNKERAGDGLQFLRDSGCLNVRENSECPNLRNRLSELGHHQSLRLFACDACKGNNQWHCQHSQSGLVEAAGVDPEKMQGCTYGCNWQIAGGIESAEFATMTVTPSLDGSKGGLWHGFITNGEIVGGI